MKAPTYQSSYQESTGHLDRVFLAVLSKGLGFGSMASGPLKMQALKSCCE